MSKQNYDIIDENENSIPLTVINSNILLKNGYDCSQLLSDYDYLSDIVKVLEEKDIDIATLDELLELYHELELNDEQIRILDIFEEVRESLILEKYQNLQMNPKIIDALIQSNVKDINMSEDEKRIRILKALETLSENRKEIVIYAFFSDKLYSDEEISKHFGISESKITLALKAFFKKIQFPAKGRSLSDYI